MEITKIHRLSTQDFLLQSQLDTDRANNTKGDCVRHMADSERPQSLSRALLSLGRINSAESPISFGLEGFYKARKFKAIPSDEKEEAKSNLKRFEEFCKGFTAIMRAEEEGDANFQKQWIAEKKEGELTSRIEIFLSSRALSHSLFQNDKKLAQRWLREFKKLEGISEKTRGENVDPAKVEDAIKILRELRSQFKEAFNYDKKTSEKILSGRTLFT
jgi:hypothetical protein